MCIGAIWPPVGAKLVSNTASKPENTTFINCNTFMPKLITHNTTQSTHIYMPKRNIPLKPDKITHKIVTESYNLAENHSFINNSSNFSVVKRLRVLEKHLEQKRLNESHIQNMGNDENKK